MCSLHPTCGRGRDCILRRGARRACERWCSARCGRCGVQTKLTFLINQFTTTFQPGYSVYRVHTASSNQTLFQYPTLYIATEKICQSVEAMLILDTLLVMGVMISGGHCLNWIVPSTSNKSKKCLKYSKPTVITILYPMHHKNKWSFVQKIIFQAAEMISDDQGLHVLSC